MILTSPPCGQGCFPLGCALYWGGLSKPGRGWPFFLEKEKCMCAASPGWATGRPYLMTPLTLVRLFATVHTLVAFKMVLLDETHITDVALKWFLTWPGAKRSEYREKRTAGTTRSSCPPRALVISHSTQLSQRPPSAVQPLCPL